MLDMCSALIPRDRWPSQLKGMSMSYIKNENGSLSVIDQRAAKLSQRYSAPPILQSCFTQFETRHRASPRHPLLPPYTLTVRRKSFSEVYSYIFHWYGPIYQWINPLVTWNNIDNTASLRISNQSASQHRPLEFAKSSITAKTSRTMAIVILSRKSSKDWP